MSDRPVVIWFRRNLRLADNAALCAAVATGRPIAACYIYDADGDRAPGGAGRWWLHHSLIALSRDLEKHGGRLLLRTGQASDVIVDLVTELDAAAVFVQAIPTPADQARDHAIASRLTGAGIEFNRLEGALLFGPDAVRTQAGQPFQVFTPFSKACLALPDPGSPEGVPKRIRFLDSTVAYDDIEDWRLQPQQPNWAAGFEARWRPGERGAAERLDRFIDTAIAGYAEGRDRPDRASTSRLSPHLAFGEISPRQAWFAVRSAAATRAVLGQGTDSWLRQLLWREFSYYLLYHWPHLPQAPFREKFADFPWREDNEALMRWQNGITGFPLVDAGMRELWQTGWMHNRVRMVAASFLVKDLLIPWQRGEAWFWDTLVDADSANNAASWQWVAGSGADAAPYFRIFNPVTQGGKFDPGGEYVRRYVPEISALPNKYLHAPWTAPAHVLDTAGVVIGSDYPAPMVDHSEARERALAAYRSMGDGQR